MYNQKRGTLKQGRTLYKGLEPNTLVDNLMYTVGNLLVILMSILYKNEFY